MLKIKTVFRSEITINQSDKKNNMKNIFVLTSALVFVILMSGCGNNNISDKKIVTEDSIKSITNEAEVLYDFLDKTGNYINSENIPALVLAPEVYNNLKEYHIIDVRENEDYIAGHIDGAVNVEYNELLNYLQSKIVPGAYKKIVIACYSGQKASYASSILRMLGYGNVYALKYGMSSWNKAAAKEKWIKNVSDKYSSKLVTEEFSKPGKGEYPVISTGKKTAYDILEARAQDLLNNMNFLIKADSAFASLDKYYVVNYWIKDHYDLAHIPGSFQYTPKESLLKTSELGTLPANKPILLFCYSGQHASFAAAYLNILGYDAKVLSYGTNSFMVNKMKSLGIGKNFDESADVQDFPLVEGNDPSAVSKPEIPEPEKK